MNIKSSRIKQGCAPLLLLLLHHVFLPAPIILFVKVSKRLNLFRIEPDQGYKQGPLWGNQESQERQEDPKMSDFGGDGRFDGVIGGVSKRFKLFRIAWGQDYKLRPPGGLADPIKNVRNIKKTLGWVILVETAVLMGLLSRYQGDSTCFGLLMARATNWDHLDPIRNIKNVKKTPGWKTLEERAVLMGLLSGYQEDSTCSGLLEARITNWDHLETWLTPSGTSRRPQVGWFWLRRQSWWGIVKVSRIFNLFWILHD